MKSWNSSPHPISDIRDWKESGRLEIRPDFQRLEVWSEAAKVMLMDTILRAIPMPKVFVSSGVKDGKVYRTVIDGQQRISSIIAFMEDKFALEKPYAGEFNGLRFSQLDETVKNAFYQYRIDFNEAIGFTDEELRETYSRLNKYSVALTKQELRRADYPGQFLALSEELANNEYLEAEKLFTVANRRRLADVEYISELLAALIDGPQDKRDGLDDFYLVYALWDEADKSKVKERFLAVLEDMKLLFPPERSLATTRFHQKADFYSLMLAIDELRRSGGHLENIDLRPVQFDLRILHDAIAPESSVPDCRDYAIKCVSQANSRSSRLWRKEFLKAILKGTYSRAAPSGDGAILFYRLSEGDDGGGFCPPTVHECVSCKGEIEPNEDRVLCWKVNSPPYQLDNAMSVHRGCIDEAQWHCITSDGTDGELSFSDDSHIDLV